MCQRRENIGQRLYANVMTQLSNGAQSLTTCSWLQEVNHVAAFIAIKAPTKREFRCLEENFDIWKASRSMEAHFDDYEHWNFDYEKHTFSGHSGKGRSKKEASQHTNHHDPSGHTRKVLTKFVNCEHKKVFGKPIVS